MNLKPIKVITLGLILGLTALLGACNNTGNAPTDGGTAAPEGGAETTEPAPAEGQ
jgi:hypothetical protein